MLGIISEDLLDLYIICSFPNFVCTLPKLSKKKCSEANDLSMHSPPNIYG